VDWVQGSGVRVQGMEARAVMLVQLVELGEVRRGFMRVLLVDCQVVWWERAEIGQDCQVRGWESAIFQQDCQVRRHRAEGNRGFG